MVRYTLLSIIGRRRGVEGAGSPMVVSRGATLNCSEANIRGRLYAIAERSAEGRGADALSQVPDWLGRDR